MLNWPTAQFMPGKPMVKGRLLVLLEITMNTCSLGRLDADDVLGGSTCSHIGFTCSSPISEFYRLSPTSPLTKEMIVSPWHQHVLEILNEKYYEQLEGAFLSHGPHVPPRRQTVRVPMRQDAFDRTWRASRGRTPTSIPPRLGGHDHARNCRPDRSPPVAHCSRITTSMHRRQQSGLLNIFSRDVLQRIKSATTRGNSWCRPRCGDHQQRRLLGYGRQGTRCGGHLNSRRRSSLLDGVAIPLWRAQLQLGPADREAASTARRRDQRAPQTYTMYFFPCILCIPWFNVFPNHAFYKYQPGQRLPRDEILPITRLDGSTPEHIG